MSDFCEPTPQQLQEDMRRIGKTSDEGTRVFISVKTLKQCKRLLATLTRNAPKCYGIDFGELNESIIEVDRLIAEAGNK